MSLIDSLLDTLAPYDCLKCGAEGNLLCYECSTALPTVPDRCYRCRKVSSGSVTCSKCRRVSRLRTVKVGTIYEGVAKDLVWQYKFQGAQRAAVIMAERLKAMIAQSDYIIVPVPTASSRVRMRGYDQAQLLAKQISRNTGLPYVPCMSRIGQHHQVGASRRQRVTQLNGAFRIRNPRAITGKKVILVDDVLTTGATLEAAALAVKVAGAKQVDGLVFAQA